MSQPATITLPYPPSVNRMWRTFSGRMILSREGRAYREAVALTVNAAKVRKFDGGLSVSITVNPPDKRRRDLDNTLKGLLDAMGHAGVYEDDSQINLLCVQRGGVVKGGRVTVRVEEEAK